MYEGLFLQSVVAFELLIEEMFLGLVTGRIAHPRPVKPLVIFPSVAAAKKIVTRDRYVDWLPYDNLKRNSEVYFVVGKNPFSDCPGHHSREINKAYIIRNYIAHKSDHSRRVFEREVVSPTLLPPGQRDLLGYFRFMHSSTVNKFQYHVGELVNAARWFAGITP